jgi:hypothetical protein
MPGKRFGNQTPEQILKHLGSLLDPAVRYHLSVDPLGIHYTIMESTDGIKDSDKIRMRREAQEGLSKGERKQMGTRKMRRPKIRTYKRGRTVNLKGRVY